MLSVDTVLLSILFIYWKRLFTGALWIIPSGEKREEFLTTKSHDPHTPQWPEIANARVISVIRTGNKTNGVMIID
jgi:hypothetical protein